MFDSYCVKQSTYFFLESYYIISSFLNTCKNVDEKNNYQPIAYFLPRSI